MNEGDFPEGCQLLLLSDTLCCSRIKGVIDKLLYIANSRYLIVKRYFKPEL